MDLRKVSWLIQACDWKKILKLTAKLKKAYFSGIAQITLAYMICGTVFRLFEVKHLYRPVLYTMLCCFWDFCNIFHHITGVSILFQPHTETSHAYPQCTWYCSDIFFFIFRHTHWPNNTQYWQKNGIIIHYYVKLTKAYLSLGVACLIKKA